MKRRPRKRPKPNASVDLKLCLEEEKVEGTIPTMAAAGLVV